MKISDKNKTKLHDIIYDSIMESRIEIQKIDSAVGISYTRADKIFYDAYKKIWNDIKKIME